jgi:hypothetical protein
MRGPTRRKNKQSNKVEIGKYSNHRQILTPNGPRKAKKNFTVSIKTPNRTEEKATLKGTTEMARLRGSAR